MKFGFNTLRVGLHALLLILVVAIGWRLTLSLRSLKPGVGQGLSNQNFDEPRQRKEDGLIASRSHLFGVAPPSATATAPVTVVSSIRVIGILATGEPKDAWAILDVDGDQRAYGVGNTLSDGETLVAVEADRVTLDRGGDRYSVMLEMPQADPDAHFETLDLGATALDFNAAEGPKPALATPTQQVLQSLRQQILSRPRLKLPPKGHHPTPTVPPSPR